jgi:hypothetical protein
MNLNHLAKKIAEIEGGRVNLPIGQIKEVMRILLTELASMEEKDLQAILRRYSRRGRSK